MPLTPQTVHDTVFTSRRVRRGYHEDEVDAFLDEVEAELVRLLGENDELRRQLAVATGGAVPAAYALEPEAEAGPLAAAAAPARAAASQPPGSATDPAAGGPALIESGQGGEQPDPGTLEAVPSQTEELLRRTLVLATRTADAAINEAKAEAERLVNEARDKARNEEREYAEHRAALTRELEGQRDGLQTQIERLRNFEREYRTRLRVYLEMQLRDLGETAMPPGGPPAVGSGAAVDSPQAALPVGDPAADESVG